MHGTILYILYYKNGAGMNELTYYSYTQKFFFSFQSLEYKHNEPNIMDVIFF